MDETQKKYLKHPQKECQVECFLKEYTEGISKRIFRKKSFKSLQFEILKELPEGIFAAIFRRTSCCNFQKNTSGASDATEDTFEGNLKENPGRVPEKASSSSHRRNSLENTWKEFQEDFFFGRIPWNLQYPQNNYALEESQKKF